MEEDLRRVAREHPDHWLAQAQLGLLLQDVGRVNEGILHSQRVLEIDPYLPVGNAFLIRALSIARRLQEADALSRRALERWPSHPMVWNVRFNVLLFSNRAGSAAAFVSDPEHQPELLQPSAVAMRLTLARAVEERRSADIEASVEAYRRLALDDVQSLPIAAAFLALLGRPDLCFSALERYYFGTGSFGPPIPPPGRYDRRFGIALFAPPITELRQDPRYQSLLDRTGLTDYWRQTHTIPDFRRA
jgi:tetratricopeptide (TPR) repeat protein